jgi:hypothetical protein
MCNSLVFVAEIAFSWMEFRLKFRSLVKWTDIFRLSLETAKFGESKGCPRGPCVAVLMKLFRLSLVCTPYMYYAIGLAILSNFSHDGFPKIPTIRTPRHFV